MRTSNLSRILGVTLLGALLGACAAGSPMSQPSPQLGEQQMQFGNKVQNNYADKQAGSHVIVRLDNGVHVAVTQPLNPDLYVGERVMIQGSGQSARVVRS